MKVLSTVLLCAVCCWGCNNIEDASPSKRKTFIRFYESGISQFGVAAELIDDGYVLVSYELKNNKYNTFVRRIDHNGHERISERVVIPDFKANSSKVNENGIYLTGDRIELNPSSENLFDLMITSVVAKRIVGRDVASEYIVRDTASTNLTDLHGDALTFDADGNLVIVGSFQRGQAGAQIKPFITVLDAISLQDTVWAKKYESLERDFVNGKSAHISSTGNVIWSSYLLKEAGDLSNTILTVANAKAGTIFPNNDRFGETTDQRLIASDIQPANSGYGLIGTYARPSGKFANLFFIRIDRNGNFVQGSDRYFDGETLLGNTDVTADISLSEDTGDAITFTTDGGYILAGSMQTTVGRGNGGKDILLIKVDGSGNLIWNKLLGSEGDETLNSIRETEDGHLILCGTNNLAGLAAPFIIKTDKNGEIKN